MSRQILLTIVWSEWGYYQKILGEARSYS